MKQTSFPIRGLLWPAAWVSAVLLPMAPLLRPGLAPRVNDWENSLWAAGYAGRYLSVRGAVPGVLNADRFVGQPVPVFYAPLLYPALGAAGAVVGTGVAIRAAAVLVWALQFALTCRLLRVITGSPGRALAGGAMACWAIYPLTNLYNRGAIAEFFGATLLACAACAGGLALLEADRRRRVFFALLCGLCGAAAAGSHAITAAGGGVVLACLAPAALRLRGSGETSAGSGEVGSREYLPPDETGSAGRALLRLPALSFPIPHLLSSPSRRRLAVAAVLGLAVLGVMSPWVYATLLFGGRLRVAQAAGGLAWIREYDSWYVRLSPVPLPTPAGPALSVGLPPTPCLDPQLNLAMLALLAWTLSTRGRAGKTCGAGSRFVGGEKGRRQRSESPSSRSTADSPHSPPARSPPAHSPPPQPPGTALLRISLAIFAVVLGLSVTPAAARRLPAAVGSPIQFAYRLVTYQNLTLFTALVAALLVRTSRGTMSPKLRRADAIAWGAALALSAMGLAVKLAHAAATLGPAAAEAAWAADPDSLGRVPDTYYADRDYSVVDEAWMLHNVPPAERRGVHAVVALPPGDRFGEPGTASFDEPAESWVKTDVIAFPWNRLVLDGREVPTEQVRNGLNRLAVRVSPGRHTLAYRFEPPAVWRVLRAVSLVGLTGWVVLLTLILPWAFAGKRPRRAPRGS